VNLANCSGRSSHRCQARHDDQAWRGAGRPSLKCPSGVFWPQSPVKALGSPDSPLVHSEVVRYLMPHCLEDQLFEVSTITRQPLVRALVERNPIRHGERVADTSLGKRSALVESQHVGRARLVARIACVEALRSGAGAFRRRATKFALTPIISSSNPAIHTPEPRAAFAPSRRDRSARRFSQKQTGKDSPWQPAPWPCSHWREPSRDSCRV